MRPNLNSIEEIPLNNTSMRILASIALLILCAPAFAMAQRTFVASHGNDANTCALTQPCRGFAAAVAQTSVGGEVIVLDSAGYGSVTITKSVSITVPPGVYGGISVPGTADATGVLVANSAINVVLRGLTINSVGAADGISTYGIRMTDGAAVTIENCVVSNFAQYGGVGVSIESPAKVAISGSVIRDSHVGLIAGYGATVNISNSQVTANLKGSIATRGIFLTNAPGGGTTTRVSVSDTTVSGFETCIDNSATTDTTGHINAIRINVTGCLFAIINEPFTGTTTVGYSMVSGSGVAFEQDSGTFYTLGNNQLSDNGTDYGGGSISLIGMK